jgi:redox-sensitive bicupin YhaK (pirin superfamily)
VALPRAHEEAPPAFEHFDATRLPLITGDGVTLRVITGEMQGRESPVALPMATVYAEAQLQAGASMPFEARYAERAIYMCDGEIEIDGERFGSPQLLLLRAGHVATIRAVTPTRFMLLGGEPADGPRFIWWNFVASSRERIEVAKAQWQAGNFAPVPGETEFIPLPT